MSVPKPVGAEPFLQIKRIVKQYGDVFAVDDVSLNIEKGEIFALLGPNGAGKTTTVEILEGYRSRDGGSISVLGVDPANTDLRAWRNRIGIVLQSTKDAADLTVEEAISHFAGYYSNPKDVDQVITAVGLSEKRKAKGEQLSGGQRRRLDVALGILGNPELLFLDEPTTGFDPEARRAFWDLIRQLKNDGTTILMTTHYLDEAEALADRLAVMTNGKILEVSTPALLGGRARAKARVSWSENGRSILEITDSPTQFVNQLSARIGGEIADLSVSRPNLEDIYLEMIGEKV
jgi:ABC-2 type transport system ATP-binding protein